MSAHRRGERGPPPLLAGSGHPFAPWWSGDRSLDAMLACKDAAEAASALVGSDRSTRPVVRSLALSLVGPGGSMGPGATANLLPASLVVGVDAPHDAPDRLAPDDIAAVLSAGVSAPWSTTRRAPVRVFARDTLQQLVAGYSRGRRRDLAIEVLTDRSGAADALLRLLDEAAEVAYLDAFRTPTTRLAGLVDHLQWVLSHYRVPSRRATLSGARAWRDNPCVDLSDGLQVRVPVNREQLESEAEAFDNCLGSYYGRIEIRGVLIATVWSHGVPVAAAEISPSGGLKALLGCADAEVDHDTRELAVGALRQAGALPTPAEPVMLTARERVAGRIACRAALLLAEEIEPAVDDLEFAWSGRQYGDHTLELLDRYACLLTEREYELLRAGRSPEPIDGWSQIGVMLIAAGEDDPALASLDGRAPFRQAARTQARQILYGTHLPSASTAADDLHLLLMDPTVPRWQRDAITEVLEQYDDG